MPTPKIKHDWYQTETHVFINILAKNVENVKVHTTETAVSKRFTIDRQCFLQNKNKIIISHFDGNYKNIFSVERICKITKRK